MAENEFDSYAPETTMAAPDPAPVPEANPFDGYDDNVLKAGPAPSMGDSFGTNFAHAQQQTMLATRAMLAQGTLNEARAKGLEHSDALNESRHDIETFLRSERAYDSFESDGFMGKAAGFLGAVSGSLFAPENVLLPGFGKLGGMVAARAVRAGLSERAAPYLARSVEFGAFSGAADSVDQAANIAVGEQEKFDTKRLLLSTALGAGFGASMEGATQIIRKLVEKKPPADIAPGPREAAPSGEPVRAEDAPSDASMSDVAAQTEAMPENADMQEIDNIASSKNETSEITRDTKSETQSSAGRAEDVKNQQVFESGLPTREESKQAPTAQLPSPALSSDGSVAKTDIVDVEKAAKARNIDTSDAQIAQKDYQTSYEAATKPIEKIADFDSVERLPDQKKQAAGVFQFDATELKTDAQRFQFKDGGDQEGVSHALKGIAKWDPAKANQVIVWQAKDGALYVVDGHQRSGLARRLVESGFEDKIKIPGLLYREVDGITDRRVRAIAAAKNIAEGSGSPIDGAKILRESPDLFDGSMPLSRTEARQSFDLAALAEEPWRMVINEVVPANYAAQVGRIIPKDAERQLAAMNALARFEPTNEQQAAILVQRVRDAELAKAEAKSQTDMFGDLMGSESTAGEEMKIVDRAIKTLARDKALFSRVVANADRIEQTGSTVARGAAQSVASDAQIFAKVLTSEAYAKGPIRDALTDAARKVKNVEISIEQAARELVRAVEKRSEGGLAARAGDSSGGKAGERGQGAGFFDELPMAAKAGRGKPGTALSIGQAAEGLNAERVKTETDVRQLVDLASQPGHNHRQIPLGATPEWLADAARVHGLDINGFNHSLDTSAVRHILRRHGTDAETRRGGIPLTAEDVVRLPDILDTPDKIAFGAKSPQGRPLIVYVKKMPDGSTVVLEEVRAKTLAIASMRKYPATIDVLGNVDLYVRNDGGASLKIIDPPEGVNRFRSGETEQALKGSGPVGPNSANRRRSNRVELPGEASKPKNLPDGVSDEEVRGFKLTQVMRDIAARMGRRLELDGRIKLSNALGTYKPQQGVLRVRYAGDVDVFAHELGHAIDQRLLSNPATEAAWDAVKMAHPSELLPLDFNAQVTGSKASYEEGAAEFLRMFITNPAYAAKRAPLTYDAFRAILAKQPELDSILSDAARMSQIESGLKPTQVFSTMVAIEPDGKLEKFADSVKRFGIVPTLKDYASIVYGGLVRENVHFDRLARFLREARFQKTQEPVRELSFSQDPEYLFRQLPGAHQQAIDILDRGVPLDPTDPFTSPRSNSFNRAVEKALNGSISRIENQSDPLVRDFNGYLVARRAVGEWTLFQNGDIPNQPVRASRNETMFAIADFEHQYPQFREAADEIFAFQRAYLQRRVDKHLVSHETAQAFLAKRQDHIPLYRSFEGELAGGMGSTPGKSLEFDGLHKFSGSTRDVTNVLKSVIEDVARTERRIAENDVRLALDDLARDAGEFAGPVWEHVPNTEVRASTMDLEPALRSMMMKQGFSDVEADILLSNLAPLVGDHFQHTSFSRVPTTARGERILFFYRNGQRVAAKVGDNAISRHFYDLMTAMSEPEKDIFRKTMGAMVQAFQANITHAPRFAIGTLVRDNMTRMFMPRFQGVVGRIPLAQDFYGAYSMMFDRAFYRAYQAGGGIRGGLYSHAANELGGNALTAVAKSNGFVSRTLDELAAAKTLDAKAAVLSGVSGRAFRAGQYYGQSMIDRVRYADGVMLKAWAVATTPLRMTSDLLRLTEMGETASRVGGAKLTFKYLKGFGLSDVEAMSGALYESRDVLNYSSHGAWLTGTSRVAPFLNAAITGSDRAARGLVGEPVAIAMRSYQRGGWDRLDIKDRMLLEAAWKNWVYMSIVAGVSGAVYLTWAYRTEFYRRASDYMRRTYWLIQTGEDAEGNPVGLTIHKPYDIAGALIGSAELYAEEIRKKDPVNWGRVAHGLLEAIPRQFRSINEFLSSFPVAKTAYELALGQKMGFDGRPPRPIVPDSLKNLPLEQQISAQTSWFAKKLAAQTGTSPIVVDHVLSSLGTGSSDLTDLSTAVFDNNPLVSSKDAINRFFFGQVYRSMRSDTGSTSDLRDLMARDSGSYQSQARAYRNALESGLKDEASSIYNRADGTAQSFMTLQSSSLFKPSDRDLHPLQRSADIADTIYGMMRNLGRGVIEVQDRSRKKGEEKQIINLSNEQTRQVSAQLNMILAEETRNGLSIAGHPGYEHFDVIDTAPRVDMLRQIAPDVAKEFESRIAAKHVLPAQGVANVWPEAKKRLLADRNRARLSDLVVAAKRTPRKVPD